MAELEVQKWPQPDQSESAKFTKFLEPLEKPKSKKLLDICFANTALNHTDCAKGFKYKLTSKDLVTSGSNWQVEQFCNYIPALRVSYTDQELPKSPDSEEMRAMQCSIILSYICLAKVFKDNDDKPVAKQLFEKAYSEQTV